MRYRDLVSFDPIESVIQLRNANDKERAADLVHTYVISDRMADQLVSVVFPQIQINRPIDNKGVFVVGNYGTGKSHLLSVISAIAQHTDLVDMIRHPSVRDAATTLAGKFAVCRAEIGSVTRSLRDIILSELDAFFDEMGTPFAFPPASAINNNKTPLISAMAQFNERYPDKGVLFVLDELLDYLRSRDEGQLVLDLSFLRELGEVTEATPFRIVAGIQESLYDNPRFQFAADSLRRVRDRFEQVRIARQDIAFVVANRLLAKSDEQIARITTHLRTFTNLYPDIADHLDDYARLFPIHPAYIDTFEQVAIAEKREVLQTFSKAINSVLDREVPTDQTGLISYDHYWELLRENPTMRTLPDIATVISKSQILEGRIQSSMPNQHYRPMAIRIIHALSVFRLTTDDLSVPLGLTKEELRDQLCLWINTPEKTADFLAEMVNAVLNAILTTVSGQYITCNAINGQYYLDVAKDIDFEAQILSRESIVDDRQLNRSYWDIMQRLMEINDSPHVTSFRIWRWELPWTEKKVTRLGYIFFGPPDERSTAQPPRDHYLFVLPIFGNDRMKNWIKITHDADEVMFDLDELDDGLKVLVRRYAATVLMAEDASTYKQVYLSKAEEVRKRLITWLSDNLPSRLRAIYQGKRYSVADILVRTRTSETASLRDLINLVAAQLLSESFAARYPDYPTFTRLPAPVTDDQRPALARDALTAISSGRARTNSQRAVLSAFQLLGPEDTIRTEDSPYARYFRDTLYNKPTEQVVNFGELMEEEPFWPKGPLYKDTHFHLEHHWVAVILGAMIYDGRINVKPGNNKTIIDADAIAQLATLPLDDLGIFTFYRRPRGLPLTEWTTIMEALELNPVLLREDSTREQAVQQMVPLFQAEANRFAKLDHDIPSQRIWHTSLFTNTTLTADSSGFVSVVATTATTITLSSIELQTGVRRAKDFFNDLIKFNTPAKLVNLNRDGNSINQALAARQRALHIQEWIEAIALLQPIAAYLAEASVQLGSEHQWSLEATIVREELLTALRSFAKGEGTFRPSEWQGRLDTLKRSYIATYATLHRAHVLDFDGQQQLTRLQHDLRLDQLQALKDITLFSNVDLVRWHNNLGSIKVCTTFFENSLLDSPVCPSCRFQPRQISSGVTPLRRLELADEQLDQLLENWHEALQKNLKDAEVQTSIIAMTPTERQPIESYLTMPTPINQSLPHGLVKAANMALRGIHTVTLAYDELSNALTVGGLPCTVDELRNRFERFLQSRLTNYPTNATRLTIQ